MAGNKHIFWDTDNTCVWIEDDDLYPQYPACLYMKHLDTNEQLGVCVDQKDIELLIAGLLIYWSKITK